jgi:hypothetical protein
MGVRTCGPAGRPTATLVRPSVDGYCNCGGLACGAALKFSRPAPILSAGR